MDGPRERRRGRHHSGKKSRKKRRQDETRAKPLVEYSDVSSEDLSAPEAGEIQSEASDRSPDPQYEELLYRERCRDELRIRRKKEKKKRDKKRHKKKSKKRSRTASLDSLTPDEILQQDEILEKETTQMWNEPNGSCSPVSPMTPPRPQPLRRLTNASDISRNSYSPPKTPPVPSPRGPATPRSPHTPRRPPDYDVVAVDSDPEIIYSGTKNLNHSPRERWRHPVVERSPMMIEGIIRYIAYFCSSVTFSFGTYIIFLINLLLSDDDGNN